MITIEKKTLHSLPLLWVEESSINNRRAPLFLFWHGWTSMKEKNLHYAYMAAEQGYRVILPEATGHGERLEELSEIERKVGFWKVVLQALQETGLLLQTLKEQDLIGDENVIIGGTSMGAVITLGALKTFSHINAGVSLMGNPYYVHFAKMQIESIKKAGVTIPYSEQETEELLRVLETFDLGNNPEALNGRPLYLWHGEKDNEVPFHGSKAFYEENKHRYSDGSEIFTFTSDPQAGHAVTNKAAVEMIQWLSKLQKVSQI